MQGCKIARDLGRGCHVERRLNMGEELQSTGHLGCIIGHDTGALAKELALRFD